MPISQELQKKIDFAIKLIQSASKMAMKNGQPIEVAYSGGKDSDVILQLVKESYVTYRAIYKNTTIDPPKTISHCKSKGVEILNPKINFFNLVKKKGIPTRRARFCCEVLKEYKVLDYCIVGVRRSESNARAKRYKEPELCRTYKKGVKVRQYYPILNWTDDDVVQFISDRKIQCHPLYYDEDGAFHVERRLGCIGCPLKSDNGKNDYKKYPKLLKRLISATSVFLSTHPNCSSIKKFGDSYNVVYHNLFCKSYGDYLSKKQPNLFGETLDCKQYLENYFNIKF